MNIEEKISKFLEDYNLLDSDKTFLIGFSGGYDSMSLLHILKNLSKNHNLKLIAAHLNHNWRADESKQEELNSKDFCENSDITFYSETLSSELPHSELEARKQRYDFFKRCADKFKVDAIITGHTKTDNVETLLYRIIKGTGLKGLNGIPEIRMLEDIPVYRPMLKVQRQETINYCIKKNLKANMDSSNKDQKYARNKIRHDLIPNLKQYNKEVENSLIRLCEIAKDSQSIINEYTNIIKHKIYKENTIITELFINQSSAIKKQLIIDLLENNQINFDYKKVSEILDFIEESKNLPSGNNLSLSTNRWIFVSKYSFQIINKIKADVIESSIEINTNGKTHHKELNLTLNSTLWDQSKPDFFPKEDSNTALVDLSTIDEPIYLRTRREGDKIRPFGMNTKVKLKKYLINKGIAEFKRDQLPIIATDEEILWVVGVGISNLIRVKDIPTHKIEISG